MNNVTSVKPCLFIKQRRVLWWWISTQDSVWQCCGKLIFLLFAVGIVCCGGAVPIACSSSSYNWKPFTPPDEWAARTGKDLRKHRIQPFHLTGDHTKMMCKHVFCELLSTATKHKTGITGKCWWHLNGPRDSSLGLFPHRTVQEPGLTRNCLLKLLEQRALTQWPSWMLKGLGFLNPEDFIAVEKKIFSKTCCCSETSNLWWLYPPGGSLLYFMHNSWC